MVSTSSKFVMYHLSVMVHYEIFRLICLVITCQPEQHLQTTFYIWKLKKKIIIFFFSFIYCKFYKIKMPYLFSEKIFIWVQNLKLWSHINFLNYNTAIFPWSMLEVTKRGHFTTSFKVSQFQDVLQCKYKLIHAHTCLALFTLNNYIIINVYLLLLISQLHVAISTYYKFSFHHFVLEWTEDDKSFCQNIYSIYGLVNNNTYGNSAQTLILARRLEQDCCGQAFHHTEHEQVELKTVLQVVTKAILLMKYIPYSTINLAKSRLL